MLNILRLTIHLCVFLECLLNLMVVWSHGLLLGKSSVGSVQLVYGGTASVAPDGGEGGDCSQSLGSFDQCAIRTFLKYVPKREHLCRRLTGRQFFVQI